MKKEIGRIFLLSVLCLWCLVACGSSAEEQKIAAGREVYLANCSHCYMLPGRIVLGPGTAEQVDFIP